MLDMFSSSDWGSLLYKLIVYGTGFILGAFGGMDNVVPGFASQETLLYSPEIKFYSNKIKMDENLQTNVPHLYCLGDSSGWTRGLMSASCMVLYSVRLFTRKKEDHFLYLFSAVIFLTSSFSYAYFALKYPVWCSMNARYAMFLFLPFAIGGSSFIVDGIHFIKTSLSKRASTPEPCEK